LNAIVMVSAESAPSVEKLLVASQWGDEPVPATVVLLDSDDAGNEAKRKITGKGRNCKQLIEERFVLQVVEFMETPSVARKPLRQKTSYHLNSMPMRS